MVTQLHLKLALHDVEEFILGFVDVRGAAARLNVSVSNPSRMMRMIRNPLSARHRKSPGRVNRGFISWRVRGAGG